MNRGDSQTTVYDVAELNTTELLNWNELNNKKTERQIKEKIPFTIAMKRIKYLGINLPKKTKDLYKKTIKHWWKKSKMTQIDGEIYHVHRLEESI